MPPFSPWQLVCFTRHLTPPMGAEPRQPKTNSTSNGKLDTVQNAWRKSLQVSACAQVCVCVRVWDMAYMCKKGAGMYRCASARHPSAPSAHAATCTADINWGHMRVCLSLPGMWTHTHCTEGLFAIFFPHFFRMWENKLLLWLKWWVQLFWHREAGRQRITVMLKKWK